MSNEHGDKTTQNILIEAMAKQGIDISVRDREQYMNESMEKRGKYIAKKEIAARNTGVADVSENGMADSVDKFYSKGNKVD